MLASSIDLTNCVRCWDVCELAARYLDDFHPDQVVRYSGSLAVTMELAKCVASEVHDSWRVAKTRQPHNRPRVQGAAIWLGRVLMSVAEVFADLVKDGGAGGVSECV